MIWRQKIITLKPRPKGCHLVTAEFEEALDLEGIDIGLAHFFIQHTSASLTINENADPDVRRDLEMKVEKLAQDEAYVHTAEGPDDMPAHVQASLFGAHVTVPVNEQQLALGTWQGLYLNEHREHGGSRRVVVTVVGQK